MKIITTGRGGGKTQAMLQWMREAPEGEARVCVCISEMEAMRLYRENPDLESWQFVGPYEAMKPAAFSGVLNGRGWPVVLGFDNLDLWLQQQTRFTVGAISLTVEESPDPQSEPAT